MASQSQIKLLLGATGEPTFNGFFWCLKSQANILVEPIPSFTGGFAIFGKGPHTAHKHPPDNNQTREPTIMAGQIVSIKSTKTNWWPMRQTENQSRVMLWCLLILVSNGVSWNRLVHVPILWLSSQYAVQNERTQNAQASSFTHPRIGTLGCLWNALSVWSTRAKISRPSCNSWLTSFTLHEHRSKKNSF